MQQRSVTFQQELRLGFQTKLEQPQFTGIMNLNINPRLQFRIKIKLIEPS